MTCLSSWVLCSKWLSPPKKVLWSVPQTCVFWANGCCFRKGSVEGSANYAFLSPSLLVGSKLRELLTCLTQSANNDLIMSLLLEYSLGLYWKKSTKLTDSKFSFQNRGGWLSSFLDPPVFFLKSPVQQWKGGRTGTKTVRISRKKTRGLKLRNVVFQAGQIWEEKHSSSQKLHMLEMGPELILLFGVK